MIISMNKYITTKSVLIAIAVVIIGILVFPTRHEEAVTISDKPATTKPVTNKPVACTMDARQCPDGSFVGRIGPKCEFQACPGPSQSAVNATKTPPVTLKVKMNEEAGANGISIRPLKIVEDSRCPIDVQCIQAGRIRLEITISRGEDAANQTITLGSPFTWQDMTVTLIDAFPAPTSKKQLSLNDYLFTFSVVGEKR